MASKLDDLPMETGCIAISHQKYGACFMCCEYCHADMHSCPSCGDPITHNGLEVDNNAPHPCLVMSKSDTHLER